MQAVGIDYDAELREATAAPVASAQGRSVSTVRFVDRTQFSAASEDGLARALEAMWAKLLAGSAG